VTDAENAYATAQNLGQPLESAIYFAMDFDPGVNPTTAPPGYTEISGLNEVINYFEGVDSVFNTLHPDTYQVGVYGAVDTLLAVLGQVPGDDRYHDTAGAIYVAHGIDRLGGQLLDRNRWGRCDRRQHWPRLDDDPVQ
jgi:hypothetical protein